MCDFSNKILFLQCADAEALMINCVYIFDEKKLVTTQTETRKRIEKFFSQKSNHADVAIPNSCCSASVRCLQLGSNGGLKTFI